MKHMVRKPIALLLVCACVLALTACGMSADAEPTPSPTPELADTVSGKTLRSGASADKLFSLAVDFDKSLNPLRTKSSASLMVAGLVFDNVFNVDENYALSSRIITDWSMNDEATFFTLVVDNSIMMHDGSNLRAYDVAYSLQRAQSYSSYFASRLSSINGVSAYSDTELCISTKYADAQLLYRLTVPVMRSQSILSEAPAGSGPYMWGYSDITPSPSPEAEGEGAEPSPSPTPAAEETRRPDKLVRFSGYPGAETLPFEEIYLREYRDPATTISEYESGLIDLVVNDPSSNYSMGYGGMNEKRVYPAANMHYIGFNGYSNFLCYSEYRHAIARLVDRERIAYECLDGMASAAAMPINPASPLYSTDAAAQLVYSPEAGRAEMDEHGVRDIDDDGALEFSLSGSKVEFTLTMLVCSNNASKVTAARLIAQQLEELGFDIELKEMTWKDFQAALAEPYDEETRKPNWDMYYDEVALTADWDITPFLQKVDKEGKFIGLNYGRFDHADMRAAFESYMAAGELQRAEAAASYQQTFASVVPFIPILFEKRTTITHLGVIRGVKSNAYNIFANVENWKVDLG